MLTSQGLGELLHLRSPDDLLPTLRLNVDYTQTEATFFYDAVVPLVTGFANRFPSVRPTTAVPMLT